MRLSDNIAGVTILAFGNGAPDIFTSLVSRGDGTIIMFTELIGAGVFVTTMIAGSIAIIKPFQASLRSLMRDACFYTAAVCWISYVVWDETVYLWEAVSTFAIPLLRFDRSISADSLLAHLTRTTREREREKVCIPFSLSFA